MPSFFVPVGYEKRRARLALFRTTILWPPLDLLLTTSRNRKRHLRYRLN